jgi:ferredoxin-NADP reductase
MSVNTALPDSSVSPQLEQMAWPVFDAPLVGRELVAEATMSFTFEKPEGWSFRAGQFVDITLIAPPITDAKGNTRGFSISSAPGEGVITITTRLRDSGFKRSLQAVPLGTNARIEGPFGNLELEDVTRPAVVLTGGIGITPFRSILVEAARTGGLAQQIVLVYSNRRPAEAAFLAELRDLSVREPNLVFVPTMTDLGPADDWHGERGRIDAALLRRHLQGVSSAIYGIDGPREPIYYLTGPPGLVRTLRATLADVGVERLDIRTEEFTGY